MSAKRKGSSRLCIAEMEETQSSTMHESFQLKLDMLGDLCHIDSDAEPLPEKHCKSKSVRAGETVDTPDPQASLATASATSEPTEDDLAGFMDRFQFKG